MNDGESRKLYTGLIYNWETRKRQFVCWADVGEAARTLGPGDQLYLLDVTLEPPPKEGAPIQRAWCHLVRHDNPEPLPANWTLHDWIVSDLASQIMQSFPRDTFGPKKGPYSGRIVSRGEKQSVSAFSVPGHFFKLTIDEITKEEDNALGIWKP